MKILIVEDHYESALALSKLLTTRLGGTVFCEFARTFKEGLEKSINFNADITILDLCLPDASVDDVVEGIPYFPPPVIVVTDLDDPDHRLELKCYENDAQNFFKKAQLRSTVVSKEGADLVSAITKTYWRKVLPSARAKAIHQEAMGQIIEEENGERRDS